MDTQCASDTLDPLSQKLEDENVSLEFQLRAQLFDKVSEQKDTTKVLPKVDESNDLSNPITSNSVPNTKESKVVENDKVIAPGMFRINPFKTFREEKFVPINKARATVRTNSITFSQPYVITKKDVNSNSNGLSLTRKDNIDKTRRPQTRALCYPKNNRGDIRKLGVKGDIGFFIGYSTNSCAYRVHNRRTRKIIEMMNVAFDELSAIAF
ncbi:hypothetical protein Tco_1311066 [Tanacetum coccineum]